MNALSYGGRVFDEYEDCPLTRLPLIDPEVGRSLEAICSAYSGLAFESDLGDRVSVEV